MILTNKMIKNELKNISNVNNKISREIKNGNLIKLKNGLYETDSTIPGYLLATTIYGPSYLSFDFALSYYGLIPERVVNYTSATYDKKKKKVYKNNFGLYLYRDIPKNVYYLDVKMIEENGYTYHIATMEKALCDKLYTLKPLKDLKELEYILFKDLRIDEDKFKTLNKKAICNLAQNYHSTNVNLLAKYIKEVNNE